MSYFIANMKMITACADQLAHLGEKLFNETGMKYRAGNKVRIKGLDWYNENKGMNGLVGMFTPSMKKLCGKVVTLDSAYNGKYTAIEEEAIGYYLDDSMIEGLVEEEKSLDEAGLETDFEYEGLAYTLPEGYIFKDENGNVINAHKIVLEKKKKNVSLTQEQINTMVHDSCVLFCKHFGCGIPREICTSLGTCKEHDEYRNAIKIYLNKL